jgi:GT2 family glycosyltransferase
VQLSVVIPVYGNWWMTARCLRALDGLRRASDVAFETIVIDNASPDDTPQGMRAFPWARYERFESNRNFAGGCNAGARMAQAPVVLFLNNDAYPLGDALAPLVRAFERDGVCVAGGALLFEDGVTQSAGFVVLPNAHWHFANRNLPAGEPAVVTPRDAIGVSGAAMAVRRDWFLETGGFDEAFVNGFEDVDLCMRARAAERIVAYVPGARFAHYEGATAGRFDQEAANELLFYRRWSNAFATIPRTARGDAGAICLRAARNLSPLLAAALDDLAAAFASFGHPVVRGAIQPWQKLDARFRRSATLRWFGDDAGDAAARGVSVERLDGTEPAAMRVHGAVSLSVPWLACASPERVASLPVRTSTDPACATIAIAGFEAAAPDCRAQLREALQALLAADPRTRLLFLTGSPQERAHDDVVAVAGDRAAAVSLLATPGAGASPPTAVAGVLHAGLTDPSAFGNVLLAQGDVPSIVVDAAELRPLFASDVAAYCSAAGAGHAISTIVDDVAERARMARDGAADARRRFSPRRSAIRAIDLLCASRFGFERPAPAKTNAPIPL